MLLYYVLHIILGITCDVSHIIASAVIWEVSNANVISTH